MFINLHYVQTQNTNGIYFVDIKYVIAEPIHRPDCDPESSNVAWLFSTFNRKMHIVSIKLMRKKSIKIY